MVGFILYDENGKLKRKLKLFRDPLFADPCCRLQPDFGLENGNKPTLEQTLYLPSVVKWTAKQGHLYYHCTFSASKPHGNVVCGLHEELLRPHIHSHVKRTSVLLTFVD